MDVILIPLIQTINVVIELYIWALVISIILSWLTHFGVINEYNRFVFTIQGFLFRLTEPVLAPIRRFLPQIGGLDISPIILILLLNFIRSVLFRLVGHLI
jgi:YggT family protein